MGQKFAYFAHRVATLSGHYQTFLVALLVIAVWAVTGPFFHFSDTWQLVINTGTTIVMFLTLKDRQAGLSRRYPSAGDGLLPTRGPQRLAH
jgi:hypothetical protein